MSNDGVHFNKELDLKLKQEAQLKWMRKYCETNNCANDEFIKRYGRNYL